jgi:hypothetical protein
MFELLAVFSLMLVVISLIIIKRPLMIWYRKIRMHVWHQYVIWKIDRKIQKTAIEDNVILKSVADR